MKNKQNQESDYDYLKRTIGPGSWIYEILEHGTGGKKGWDLLQEQLKNCEGDENKQRAILKSVRFKNL